ncbi:MAG: preprotein translocase subunit SecE, partial [Candidatus Magasanikiibacteriota bacterium]
MKKITFKTKIKIPFLGDILTSFKAVQWPTVKDLAVNMLAVLVISAIIGAYLWILDTSFGNLRNV